MSRPTISVQTVRGEDNLTITERCGCYTRVVAYRITLGQDRRHWISQSGVVSFTPAYPGLNWDSGLVYGPFSGRAAQRKLDGLLSEKLQEGGERAASRSALLRCDTPTRIGSLRTPSGR